MLAGLTPIDAIRTATYNPAQFLGLLDMLGTIEPGKLSEMVLLDANPLDDITNTTKINIVFTCASPKLDTDQSKLVANIRSERLVVGGEKGSPSGAFRDVTDNASTKSWSYTEFPLG